MMGQSIENEGTSMEVVKKKALMVATEPFRSCDRDKIGVHHVSVARVLDSDGQLIFTGNWAVMGRRRQEN